jgi:outer membrane protein OmpA-like peptidoglycan-associated protein
MPQITFIFLLLYSIACGAQNLIRNPGFEIIDTSYSLPDPPLDTFDLHNVTGWYNPGFGTTDYYNSDGKHQHCGSRFFGKDMKAHTGVGFGGIYIEKGKWKEYIAFNLTDTLKAGQNYHFSMWMATSPKSRYAMQTMQLAFWNSDYVKIIGTNDAYPRMNPAYDEININGTARSSLVGTWTQLSVDFTAIGGETSIIIGYFADYWQSISLPETAKNKTNDPYCYYYIDDLELTATSGPPIRRNSVSRPVIYFDTDKDIIKKEFFAPLDSVVTVMKQDALLKVTVNGYTDSVGNVEDNLDLSRRRAEAVKKYLVDRGINENRISVAWYAESKPAGDENAINRRVEFIYIRNK